MLIGLVGKPNVGKSTFFKAATASEVLIANYPFATIKPNHGVGYVQIECIDKEFNTQCHPRYGFCINHQRFVPIDLMDVAGLVPGASEGKGLGNQFLDNLREADAFIQIVDASGTTDIEGRTTENHDIIQDVQFLEKELDLWYVNLMQKVWKTFARKVEQEKSQIGASIAKQFSGLKITEDHVKEVLRKANLPEKIAQWSEQEIYTFAHKLRELTKPMIIAANKADHPNSKANITKLQEQFPNIKITPCAADAELALREATKAGLIEYVPGSSTFKIIKEVNERQKAALDKIQNEILNVYGNTGVQNILNYSVFDLLKKIAIFPAGANKLGDSKGNILPDCFLLQEGATALDFAYHLHTDLGNNFIKAIDARTKQARGKEYLLKHRDALEIVTK